MLHRRLKIVTDIMGYVRAYNDNLCNSVGPMVWICGSDSQVL